MTTSALKKPRKSVKSDTSTPPIPYLSLPVMGYEIRVRFYHSSIPGGNERDLGMADWVKKEIGVVTHYEGRKLDFESIFAALMHELGHMWSSAGGHRVYESDDDDETDVKERALDTTSGLQAQTMLQGGMMDQKFLDRLRELIDNVE